MEYSAQPFWLALLSAGAEAGRPVALCRSRPSDGFSGLPPAYTFVGDGEPFYAETVQYIENLKAYGISASVDVYHSDMHAFDMMQPDTPLSREAARRFNEQFAYAQTHYFAPQGESER